MISDDEISEISYGFSKYSTTGDVCDVCEYDEEQGIRLMDSSINGIVSHAKEILGYTPALSNQYVSEASCIRLLCRYRWDVTALKTDMQEDRVFNQMLSPIPMNLVGNACDSNANLTCDICANDVPYEFTSSGGCGHSYCNSCWGKYITTCIDDDKVFAVKCMHAECECFLESDNIIAIAQDSAELFIKKRFTNFVSRHSDLVYCPKESCSVLLKATPDVVSVTCCKCHHEFCQMCNEAAHWPASCGWSGQFEKACNDIKIAALRQILPTYNASSANRAEIYDKGFLPLKFRQLQLLFNQLRETLIREYLAEAGVRIVLAVAVLCKHLGLDFYSFFNYIRGLLRQTELGVTREILEILDLTRNRWYVSPAVIACLEETLRTFEIISFTRDRDCQSEYDAGTENIHQMQCRPTGDDSDVLQCEYDLLRRVIELCPDILDLECFKDAKNEQEILTETHSLLLQIQVIEDREKDFELNAINIRDKTMVHEAAVKAVKIICKGYRLARYFCIHLLNMGDLKRARFTDLYMQFVPKIMECCESTLNILESQEFGLKSEEGPLIDACYAAEGLQTQFVDIILRDDI